MTRSTHLTVAVASAESAAVVDATGSEPIVAVGVPAVSTDDGPRLADGVPVELDVPGGGVSIALNEDLARRCGFSAKAGESLVVLGTSELPSLVFVGCGAVDGSLPRCDALRRAAAALVRASGQQGAALFLTSVPLMRTFGAPAPSGADGAADADAEAEAAAATGQAITEGAVLASYRFLAHKSEEEGGRVGRLVIVLDTAPLEMVAALAEGARRGEAGSAAACLARDLVNEPPSSMNPRRLAEIAKDEVAGASGVTVEVWDESRIAEERLGGLLGVARGSAEPPRLVEARFEPTEPLSLDGKVPHVVLVGKGITFDSGGLSLKTAEGMATMKTDMSGAAAVLAVVSACGAFGVRVRVTAIAPVTENMPGGRATKPGDVLTIRNGRTIEVLNTDAEGRLVLADGLTLATEMNPDAIIDVATLTGACVVALGDRIAGLFGNDALLVERIRAASTRAGEPMWPLPLPEEYHGHIESEIADMKNIGKTGQAGAISAALLLARFVDDVPWAHLDIAGPARSDDDKGVLRKGGTGFAVRTLLELLAHYGDGS